MYKNLRQDSAVLYDDCPDHCARTGETGAVLSEFQGAPHIGEIAHMLEEITLSLWERARSASPIGRCLNKG